MKKITFLFALLCASVMGWAGGTQYCNVTSPNANFTFSLMNVSGNLYRIQFDAVGDIKFASTPFNNNCGVNQTEGAGIAFGNEGWIMTDDRAYKDFTTATSTSVPTNFYGNYFCFNQKGGGLIIIDKFNPSDVDWSATCGASCTDTQAPSVSAVAVSDITYNSAVLTITASDNTAVTRYVVKNGDTQIEQSTSNVITLSNLASGTTYNNIKVYAYDACNNESDAFSVTAFTTETITYCRYATGHMGQAEFGDANGRILLTVRKISSSSVGVKVEPNNGGSDVFDYVQVILNGVGHDLGSVGGSDPTNVETVYEGLASLDFTLNILWHHSKWADAGGRWTTNTFNVTEDQLCEESPIVLSEGSEYCGDYGVECARGNGAYAYLKWETTEDGDVIITMVDGSGSTNARFRGNNGMGENLNGFTVLSGNEFATSEPASDYFTRVYVANGNTFKLQRKGGVILPSPAKIRFASPALEWYCTQDGDGYAWPTYEYTYGKICAAVSGYAVSASVNDAERGSATATVNSETVTRVDAGTTVTFTATPNIGCVFVNWTNGSTIVSTDPVCEVVVNEDTYLTANFDYIRNTYCHTAVTSSEGKKFYMTLGSIGGGLYQIKFEGSSEAKITGLNDANFVINGVSTSWDSDGDGCPFTKANDAWTFDDSGYGSYYTTFALADGKTINDINAWNHFIYFACEDLGQQTLTNAFPNRYAIAWNETCSDAEAPVLAAPVATALNTTDVQLTLSATDNWEGFITYNINYKPTADAGEGVTVTPAPVHASGEEFTVDILGLTTNTEYTFTVTASDGINASAPQSCTATPAGDVTAPTDVTISAVALTDHIVRLTLFANDDYAGDITYNIMYDNAGVAITTAPRGETKTLDIAGLEANTDYHFVVVATDAANNSAAAVNADAVHTYAANLALGKPAYAGKVNDPATNSNNGNINDRWNTGEWPGLDKCWWYVDLGAVYDLTTIRIFWEGAYATDYDLRVSNDAENWTNMATYTSGPSHVSQAEAEVYTTFSANQGRYVGLFARAASLNGQWGISFWEFEVYGTLAADAVAPVISSFSASGASTTSVLLQATADDNFKGNLTYTFYCDDVAQADPVVMPAGQEATYTVNGLTMGTNYNFKVNVSDGINNTMSDAVVSSPINDDQAPTGVTVATKSKSDAEIVLTLSAIDNLGGMIYYTVTTGETVKNAQALSGAEVDVTFSGLDYNTPYAFSIVAKDGSNNAAAAVDHNESTLPASYPTSYAPAPTFIKASVRPVYSSAYDKDCGFADWGGSYVEKQTYGAKKLNADKAYFGIIDFGTIKVNADDELYMSVWTNENISFRVVPIIHNADESANLPERGAFTQELIGGQWNVVRFTMTDFILDGTTPSTGYDNFDKIYQIKIDNAGNQTFWLDNIYFHVGPDYDREVTAGNYGTICLPQAGAIVDATLFEVAYIDNTVDKIFFDEVLNGEMVAGRPYIFQPNDGISTIKVYYTSTTTADAGTYRGLHGFIGADEDAEMQIPQNEGCYIIKNNQYREVQDGVAKIKSYRAYLKIGSGDDCVPTTPSAPASGRRRIAIGAAPQATTGIDDLNVGDQPVKVIIDGQFFILCGEKMYNANGQIVK